MAEIRLHSVSVAGIVVRDGRVLAVRRRDNGAWEPPGGVLELDEGLEDGVRREVREETGIEVAVGRLTGVYKNMCRGIVAFVFACEQTGGEVRMTAEASEISWLTLEDVGRLMDEAYAVRVTDSMGTGVQIRNHDGRQVLS